MTTQSNLRSNWKHWERFCTAAGIEPWRPDISDLDARGVEREQVIWTSALFFIHRHMEPRKGNYILHGPRRGELQDPQPKSALQVLASHAALQVLRGVRREHLDRGYNPPPLTLATRRMNEAMRRYARYIGPENLVPKRKSTLTHALITGMLAVSEEVTVTYRVGGHGGAAAAQTDDAPPTHRGAWSWRTSFGKSYRALIHTLAQTGFRKAEVALGNEQWGNMHISFDNLTWWIGGVAVYCPSAAQLRSLKEGDYAIIRPPPSKPDPWGEVWGNHPIYLPFCSRAAINAARELAQWEIHAQVATGMRRSTPLFCGPAGVGSPLKQTTCDDVFQGLLSRHMGSAAAAKDYSVHSMRSYLASAMMAARCTDAQIQAALRWSSAEALAIYKNANMSQYGGWLLTAEQQKLTGMRAVNLPRPLPQTDNINRAVAVGGGRRELATFADQTDTDVGSPVLAVTLEGRREPPDRFEMLRATAATASGDGGLPVVWGVATLA